VAVGRFIQQRLVRFEVIEKDRTIASYDFVA